MYLRLVVTLSAIACSACSSGPKQKPVDWRQVPVSLELRLAEGAPGSGLVRAPVYGQRKTVYLHPQPLVTNRDISRVEAVQTRIGRGLILEVWLSRAGAARLRQETGRHIGDSLAVVVDSAVVALPVIQQAIGGDPRLPFDVGVPLEPKEAQQLAAAVAKTWPPAQRRPSGRR